MHIPVVTVDGPSGSGKGTLSAALALALNWHFLDSGALYRVLALAAQWREVALDDEPALATLASALNVVFDQAKIFLEGVEVSYVIRTEGCGEAASRVAALGAVREALLERQRAFKKLPGLVADGRDMGTVVFPEADLKIFLEASAQERAKRRQGQLKEQGIGVSLDELFVEIAKRDKRDRERSVSPLVAAADAIIVDTTVLSIEEVLAVALEHVWKLQKGWATK